MTTRCHAHHHPEPCLYCKQGLGPFENVEARIEALERRVGRVERGDNRSDGLETTINIKEAIGVVRDYALGDIVMLSASLQALHQEYPDRPLVLVTREELYDVLQGADYLAGQLPKHVYQHAQFFKTYDLCGEVETDGPGKCSVDEYLTTPRPDIFAKKLGVSRGWGFPVPVNPKSLAKIRTILKGCQSPIIGLAPTCNSAYRVIPPEYIKPLINKLLKVYDGTVLLVGKTVPWSRDLAKIKMPRVINLIDTLDIKELIAACSLMDATITPDSGTMHIAGALGVHCLCLMGNNNPKNFAAFYPSVQVMQPNHKDLPCRKPCNDRAIPCEPLPKGQIGANCMQAMNPDKVITVFKKFYNGKNIAYVHDTPLDYIGGAEITTRGMIRAGNELGYNIRLFNGQTPLEQFYGLYNYDLIIISNIWHFSIEVMSVIMQAIRSIPYIKYEHDHEGLGDAPQDNFPKEKYAVPIYANSVRNIFVSPAQKDDYADLSEGGLCIPELIDTEMFRPVPGIKRERKSALIGIPRKWDSADITSFIKQHPDLKVDVLDRFVPHEEMPALYSQYESFVHFPQGRWPCDRVIFEAALCGCKIVTNGTVEAMSWQKDLTDQEGLRSWLKEIPQKFWDEIGCLMK